ncbi:MAG: energy-coupling factor ABC transporter substrate-binding protein [Clostridia bacterium]|nr:energy-coupling factor ABC transporter substrate-binding protein [Clostridia bacterium]
MSGKNNVLLILLLIGLIIAPLIINFGTEFEGADGLAEEAVGEINPNYEPWFASVWEPPGGEIESLLFALQAAIGAGFICFYLGYRIGQKRSRCNAA